MRSSVVTAIVLSVLLGGCADFLHSAVDSDKVVQPVAIADGPETVALAEVSGVATSKDGQLEFTLASGVYQCEWGAHVEVQRDSAAPQQLRIKWINKDYLLTRDASFSGLPRYEDAGSGLVWIDLPWKSVLLDGRNNKPLASECVSGQVAKR